MQSETGLDFTSLRKAIDALSAGLTRFLQEPGDDILRDGCILRFAVAYELSHKMMRRFLSAISPSPDDIESLSFPDLIRAGAGRGLLLDGWPRWKAFREARINTSYAYDEQKARDVFAVVPDFLREAQYLSTQLNSGHRG